MGESGAARMTGAAVASTATLRMSASIEVGISERGS
jgi:hypothetical protein